MLLIRAKQIIDCSYLRHRSMKRRVPTRVISRMARAAGVRGHVVLDLRLKWSILWRLHFAV